MHKRIIAAIIAGALAIDVSASGLADQQADFDLAEYEGNVVILDFWASWCEPCRDSFPWLNAMHDKYADQGLVIVGVNLDADLEAAAGFLTEFPPRFTIYYDTRKRLAREFDVVSLPSSYVIGRDGRVLKKHQGFQVKKQGDYEAVLRQALGAIGDRQ